MRVHAVGQAISRDGPRVEDAFKALFYRAVAPPSEAESSSTGDEATRAHGCPRHCSLTVVTHACSLTRHPPRVHAHVARGWLRAWRRVRGPAKDGSGC